MDVTTDIRLRVASRAASGSRCRASLPATRARETSCSATGHSAAAHIGNRAEGYQVSVMIVDPVSIKVSLKKKCASFFPAVGRLVILATISHT